MLRILIADHVGSYDVIDRNNKIIGYSEGYTIRRRSILAKYETDKVVHEIIKRDSGIFLIQTDNELIGVLKMHSQYDKLELKCVDENLYFFKSYNNRRIFRIQNENSYGIVSCENWRLKNIGLALTSPSNDKVILSALLAIAYDIRLGASRYIN